jgi:hypothetical protein
MRHQIPQIKNYVEELRDDINQLLEELELENVKLIPLLTRVRPLV